MCTWLDYYLCYQPKSQQFYLILKESALNQRFLKNKGEMPFNIIKFWTYTFKFLSYKHKITYITTGFITCLCPVIIRQEHIQAVCFTQHLLHWSVPAVTSLSPLKYSLGERSTACWISTRSREALHSWAQRRKDGYTLLALRLMVGLAHHIYASTCSVACTSSIQFISTLFVHLPLWSIVIDII